MIFLANSILLESKSPFFILSNSLITVSFACSYFSAETPLKTNKNPFLPSICECIEYAKLCFSLTSLNSTEEGSPPNIIFNIINA